MTALDPYPHEFRQQGQVGASGDLVVTWDSGGQINWRQTQVSVEMATAPAGAACFLRKDGLLVTPMVPTGDVAAGDPPLMLRPGETMTVEWSDCTPGDVGRVFVIYDRIGWAR